MDSDIDTGKGSKIDTRKHSGKNLEQESNREHQKPFSLEAIGEVSSCFRDKFGIPRQPGLAPSSQATIHILPPYDDPNAFDGLAACSHIWVQFIFHKNNRTQWKPRIKPPRLGGNKSLGVFATRSPIRPNAMGLSVAKLDKITVDDGVTLHISGHDLLHGTPVLDIKPYVPYADVIDAAHNTFAMQSPAKLEVGFDEGCEPILNCEAAQARNLKALIIDVLAQDPRPAYQRNTGDRLYGTELYCWNVQWLYEVVEPSAFTLNENISQERVRVVSIQKM